MTLDLTNININNCQIDDYGFVNDLSRENMENYVNKYWGAWDEKKFISNIKKDNIRMIKHEDELIGFYDFEINGILAYLHNLQIKKNYQGKKIGKYIVSFIEKDAIDKGVDRICLQVFKENPATFFYKKLLYILIEDKGDSVVLEKQLN